MHLFNLSNFALRFGIDMSVDDFNSAVTEASKAATKAIAAQFRFQDFDAYTARRDIFHCRRMFEAGNAQHRAFRLARGFIDATTGFSARYTDNPVHIRNSETDQLTDLQDTNEDGRSDYLFIDADQGLITAYSLDLTNQWVVVDYNCGLSFASDDEAEDAPGWLSEAAELQTLIYLRQNRSLADDEQNNDLPALRQALSDLRSAHARMYPDAILPVSSEPGR